MAGERPAAPPQATTGLVHLKTLGHPAVYGGDGSAVPGLRKKDLALLVYVCVEGTAVHARGRLASLLWGVSPEERARHSLTQALAADKEVVRCGTGVDCDAVALLRGDPPVDDAFSLYAGPFLEGFDPGAGAEEFREWADRRRAELRNAALRLLERAGEQAAAADQWARALRLAERAVEIDPVWEQGHRRLMRAQAAHGERNQALRHYQAFEAWLAEEVGAEPDPETRALAEQLRAAEAPSEPARPPPVPRAPPPHAPEAEAAPSAPEPPPEAPGPPPCAAAERTSERPRGIAIRLAATLLILPLILLLLGAVLREYLSWRGAAPVPPGPGESLRLRGPRPGYLAFADTLYAYPDWATLHACTGMRPAVARRVHRLPDWPRPRLPSVLRHPWMGESVPIVSDDPVDKTAYVVVGCVLAGVPDPATLDSIFGPGALGRMKEVEDSVLRRMPRAFIARGHPVRPAGTLIRAPDGRLRWITYHGGALAVQGAAVLATHCRAPADAVPVGEAEFLYYRPFATLQPARGGCREAAARRRRAHPEPAESPGTISVDSA